MRIVDLQLHRVPLCTRLPFRYGIATMTNVGHVLVALTLENDVGACRRGLAADHLPPRWFRKDSSIALDAEEHELLDVIKSAVSLAAHLDPFGTPFEAWESLWAAQAARAAQEGWPPLLAHFGTSLIERALLDAFARLYGQPLHSLLRNGATGADLGRLSPELVGTRPADWLPAQPLQFVTIRHTVGMCDPLTEAEVTTRPDSDFPVSLEASIRAYGLHSFKLKLSGNPDEDLARLESTAAVITKCARKGFTFSLDGNEQFTDPAILHAFGCRVLKSRTLGRFFRGLLFIEQPFPRTLSELSPVAAWPAPVPIILDEGDGDLPDLPRALDLGYSGVSHKNCKGIFKGLRNACLVQARRRKSACHLFTSGEDLANIGPIALLQDLAIQGAFGNSNVERNGHHYFSGLDGFPKSWAAATAHSHPDLYAPDPNYGAHLSPKDGRLALGSVNAAPFGYLAEPPERLPGEDLL